MNEKPENSIGFQTGSFRRVTIPGLPDKLSGWEMLDLSVAKPIPTAHLKLGESNGAWFQKLADEPYEKAWQLSKHPQSLPIELQLRDKHGVLLILEMARTKSSECEEPVILTINGNEWPLELDPHNLKFNKQSWYLPHYMMQMGENTLSLRVAPKAHTEVLIKSAAVMRFELEKQKRGNWCWAAVTNSLLSFFIADNGMTQCEVVKECFRVTPGFHPTVDCCLHAGMAVCNREYDLDKALDLMTLKYSCCNYPLTLDEIRGQINQGVPVAVRIRWQGGGAHFVIITAVVTDPKDDSKTWLRVADPRDRTASYMTYQMILTNYDMDGGTWTHSYLFERQRKANT